MATRGSLSSSIEMDENVIGVELVTTPSRCELFALTTRSGVGRFSTVGLEERKEDLSSVLDDVEVSESLRSFVAVVDLNLLR